MPGAARIYRPAAGVASPANKAVTKASLARRRPALALVFFLRDSLDWVASAGDANASAIAVIAIEMTRIFFK